VRPLQALTRPATKASLSFGGTGAVLEQGTSWFDWQPLGGSVGEQESIGDSFDAHVAGAYKGNGIVFACILARLLPFSEARFQFQRLEKGRPGDLYGTPALDVLERPWPNGTTGELLARMEQDVSLAGNFFCTEDVGASRRLRRLRPDWVTIITGVADGGSPWDIESKVVGYLYRPPHPAKPTLLSPAKVVHWSPIPDPTAQWRGMSWLTPILTEIESDTAATKHKRQFFRNGTNASLSISYDKSITPNQFREAVAMFEEQHTGESNAYKALHFGGGADVKPISADLRNVDFKAVQGAGETRIAAAAGVGAIMARISEGMQGSSLNAGNYGAAKRQFVDMTLRPLWRSASAALSVLVETPAGARLWTDTRDVAFLKEDQKDAAEILSKDASTIASLVDAGFDPDTAVRAVAAGDLSTLVGSHSGLFSVQLQTPGTEGAAA
jgi:phage portal protein BeeE